MTQPRDPWPLGTRAWIGLCIVAFGAALLLVEVGLALAGQSRVKTTCIACADVACSLRR